MTEGKYLEQIQKIKNQYLIMNGLRIEYLWVEIFPNFVTFLTSEGSVNINFESWNIDTSKLCLKFSPECGKLVGWENTLNVDFSQYEHIHVSSNVITDEILEKYISKWDLSSCTTLNLNNNKITDIKPLYKINSPSLQILQIKSNPLLNPDFSNFNPGITIYHDY